MGTGIINLARNVGASVGIATVTTLLSRRSQFHQARLSEHVNQFSGAYHQMVNGTTARLVSAGANGPTAGAQAQGMLYGMLQRQSAMLAFLDNFKMLGIVFLAVIPLLLLMKRPKIPAVGVPVH
jgi:MFS transporter, DHA2 family, multidrug resistance protein